ncbi:hypothetical protein LTR15_006705 [Elasticomyces elasticus]|nr:hypothetical protein LTR15_006705 [Elasticomyces elasticus]
MATTPSITAPQPTSRLMALPAELRIHIYEWLFAGLTTRVKASGARGSDGTHLSLLKYPVPEILLCSRQVYQETIGMYYSLSVVEAANDSQSLGTVLSSIPEETYRILQGVRIDCTVPDEYWDSVLEHCQGDHAQYDCVQRRLELAWRACTGQSPASETYPSSSEDSGGAGWDTMD